MPTSPSTMFMNLKGLAIRYRASADPQKLEVAVRMKRKSVDSLARGVMSDLVEAMALGAGAGEEFAPAHSSAKLVKGTFDPDKAGGAGPSFAWTLEVAGISPAFLRVMVDALANSGGTDVHVDSLTIAGSVAPTGDALSVDEKKMIAWLDDFAAYPKAWPKPGFPITRASTTRGATVTIQLRGDASPKIAAKLEEIFGVWGAVRSEMPNAENDRGMIGLGDIGPKIARKKSAVLAKWNQFDYDPGPAFDVLTNMLVHFHETVAPIVSVEYSCRPIASRSRGGSI